MGQAWPFRIEEASRYDERGPAWYWNNFSCSEHTGTHFDAPIHWISGRHLPDNSTDTIPAAHFMAPACVLDCSREAAADADFLLTAAFLRDWEKDHGRIPNGSWVLMRTDWSKRTDPVAYQNLDATGQHTPGPDTDAVRFLVEERQVLGFGSEAIGTDAGQAYHLKPPYPCHYYMHGSGRYGLQCLTNLDLLPAIGSVVIAAPLKIKQGSGSPLRVLALVPTPVLALSDESLPKSVVETGSPQTTRQRKTFSVPSRGPRTATKAKHGGAKQGRAKKGRAKKGRAKRGRAKKGRAGTARR
jgi:kynurenine formamidase